MLEAAVVFDTQHNVLGWHLPPHRSAAYLPDSRDLWEVLWEHRAILGGVAHSHPPGVTRPSGTDLETFAACEAGLGKRLEWWIITPTTVACYHYSKGQYRKKRIPPEKLLAPPWLDTLKMHSGY